MKKMCVKVIKLITLKLLAPDKFKRIMQISMPEINHSKLGFVPDVENNTILYGLKRYYKSDRTSNSRNYG